MATDSDYYPSSMDAKAAWHSNLEKHLPGAMATKYGISTATLAAVAADNTWIQYWVTARHSADAQSQQLTRYFNTIAGPKDADAPAAIVWELATPAPTEVPPGIEKRVREIAREIKGSANYAEADGILLGIQLPEQTKDVETDVAPDVEFATMPEYKLQAKFRKRGMSGIRFEYKRKGDTAWLPAGVLLDSNGSFAVPPTTPGQGEQIEVRSIYFKGNNDVGNFSPIYTPFIAP